MGEQQQLLHLLLLVAALGDLRHSAQSYNVSYHTLVQLLRRVRGLPWWFQALISIAVLLAVVSLWLTLLTDPGALTPAHTPGQSLLLIATFAPADCCPW